MAGWTSFVALGDSFTEGLDDVAADGSVVGWADRVAEALARDQTDFRYANLAVRGLGLAPVATEQVAAALAVGPDLVSIAAGGNDVLRPRFDVHAVGRQMDQAIAALVAGVGTVVVFAGFEPGPGLPFSATIAARADAYNRLVRASAARHGAVLVDLWAMRELADARMWSVDRLHLSTAGHRHVCAAVLSALGVEVPAAAPAAAEVAARTRASGRRADLAWSREYFLPWLGRRLTGRSAGDGRQGKRPVLEPLVRPDAVRRS